MRVLVTGATGYIGSAAVDALLARGHHVLGLARNELAGERLLAKGVEPVRSDFDLLPSLHSAVRSADVDAVVSVASVGASSGDSAQTFARDRDAVRAIQSALHRKEQVLVFTSGSAVFGIFNGGEATDAVFAEDSEVPLSASRTAPVSAAVPRLIATAFTAAMNARVQTEQAVLNHPSIRGMVVRPGLVYGNGGSYDLPALIDRARTRGRAGHLGRGATLQGYVHIDDLAELYCLAVEQGPKRPILHGTVGEVTQLELAQAVNALLNVTGDTENLTLMQMLEMGAWERLGLSAAERLPARMIRAIGARLKADPSVGTGISLSLNKRLSSERTREAFGWKPERTDILIDIRNGSYQATR